MDTDPGISRRHVLAGGAAGLGVVALAGCSAGGAGGAGGDGDEGGEKPGTTPTAKAGASLAALDDITVGSAVAATTASGDKVLVCRPTATTAKAFSAVCTHQGCTVAPKGKVLACPCHGSEYDATTGKVLKGPAPKPLPAVEVHVKGGKVVTGKG